MNHETRWTAQKIVRRLDLIEPLVVRRRVPLPPFRYLALAGPEDAPPVSVEFDDSAWQSIAPNTHWGAWETDFVLRTTFIVPDAWPADSPLALHLPLGDAGEFSHPEALAYIDGVPYAACDRHHQEIALPDHVRDGQPHTLALHGWTGRGGFMGELRHDRLLMRTCAVIALDQPTRDFIATARVALGVADELTAENPAKDRLYNALDAAFSVLDTREPLGAAFYASVPRAHAMLRDGIAQAGPALDVDLVAAGHAHIDIAWLWTVAQARRKAGRTFHTVLRLMAQFPDYQFTQSQPQLYAYLERDYPDLFSAITERVREGRWEPIGGMWVEADCNLSGAEALARQFLIGRTYFRDVFGPDAESPVLWLPDVFGYAWNLPQLIKEAGLEYFFTIKISWNQYNRLPYDSFWWQGLDGTRVLTHFSTTPSRNPLPGMALPPSTYNAAATPREVIGTWRNAQHKSVQRPLLMSFGYGDGGGGPTREMLENIREMAAFPATPRVRHGRAIDFFRDLEQTAGDKLPTWNGELYLEYHRGTYTTQAHTKRENRKCEFLLHDAEFLAAWAALETEFVYPQAELARAWRLLCLNQFHDILPGSSIGPVYADSARDYATIRALVEPIREAALAALAGTLSAETDIVIATCDAFGGHRVGLLDEQLALGQALVAVDTGTPLLTQTVADGTLIKTRDLEPHSIIGARVVDGAGPDSDGGDGGCRAYRDGDAFVLENEVLAVRIDAAGDLVSLFDKSAAREVLAPGERGNVFHAFEDRPLYWDAWDIDAYYDDKQFSAEAAHAITIIENGPVRAAIEVRRRLFDSEIVQQIRLTRNSRRLDFDTRVAWRERHMLLKVAFPVDILSPTATFDVQWGNVERPTHQNTSWDWARFETCAHKWVDLSEGDYGVSLLNDCKYGHDVRDNVLRLTLLRSPTFPDAEADQGVHRFVYSVLPHSGDWRSETVREAYALNDPLLVRRVGGESGTVARRSLLAIDASHVIIETVKQAEDGDGIIVRLYENERRRGPVMLRTGFPLAAAHRCNLLEEPTEVLPTNGDTTTFSISPYQIVTLRLRPLRPDTKTARST